MPSSGRLFVQAATASGESALDWKAARPPLLLIAEEKDRTVSAPMNRANHKKYGGPSSTVPRVFDGRSHWIIAEPGWDEVADFALTWGLEKAGR